VINYTYYRWFPDLISASVFAGSLWQMEVDARVMPGGMDPSMGFWVLVPSGLVHRARWLETTTVASEGELVYLATGQLGEDSEEPNGNGADRAA